MKTALSIAALLASASAQYYNISSNPFQIVLTSDNGCINDTVSACHTGAAIESLCLSNSNTTSKRSPIPYSTFGFNTSVYSQPSNDTNLGTPGIVTWSLPTSNAGNISSSLEFSYDPTTNVALPLLFPGSDRPQILAFDGNDELLVQGYIEYTTNPPSAGTPKAYKRWYACRTYYSGYQYENLVWGLGPQAPENPTCVGVTVKRVFV